MSKLLKPSRRLFLATAAGVIAAPAIVRAGSLTLLGAGGTAGGAGPTATTWNPADKSANITLTNSNLTATDATAASAVRAVANHSTGKYYFEVHLDTLANNAAVGICDAAMPLSRLIGVFDNDGIGWTVAGDVWLNGVNPSGSPVSAFVQGNTVSVAVDMGNSKIWFRVNAGNWNNNVSGDPAGNVGGISFATMNAGPWFPAFTFTGTSDAATANFGGSSYAQSVPAGFANW